MPRGACRWAYFGGAGGGWDKFCPLVVRKRPAGSIPESANLVPSWGQWNQSKREKNWKSWMRGPAPQSPATRRVAELEEKIRRLEAYEAWRTPTRIDFELASDPEMWRAHWENLTRLFALMQESERHARILREKIKENR